MSKHPIVHIEISTHTRQESADFYSKVFGWGMQNHDELNYTSFTTGQPDMGGGLNPVGENTEAGTVSVYIGTDDIEASLAAIEANGGQTVAPKIEIPGMGWFAEFKDPTGNVLALYKGLEGQGD